MKPGTKLKSAVCNTEVMVIRGSDVEVMCGGATMSEQATVDEAAIDSAFAQGTLIGKRYVDSAGTVELLCVKPGKGSLTIDGASLQLKEAKPLPSSD